MGSQVRALLFPPYNFCCTPIGIKIPPTLDALSPIYGDVAQLGERQLCKLDVEGSSPFISTSFFRFCLGEMGMKQGKNPTVAQKRWLTMEGLDPTKWLVVSWTAMRAIIKNRETGKVKTIDMFD